MNHHRIATIIFAGAVIATATAVAVAEPAPWEPRPDVAGVPEDVYCARLLAWHDAHPDAPEIDGWPAYCRVTYPDRTLTGRLVTSTTTSSTSTTWPVEIADPAVVTAPGFTG